MSFIFFFKIRQNFLAVAINVVYVDVLYRGSYVNVSVAALKQLISGFLFNRLAVLFLVVCGFVDYGCKLITNLYYK